MMLSRVLHCSSWLINEPFLIRVDPAVELLEPLLQDSQVSEGSLSNFSMMLFLVHICGAVPTMYFASPTFRKDTAFPPVLHVCISHAVPCVCLDVFQALVAASCSSLHTHLVGRASFREADGK